jgi:hypothetical protein
MNDDRLIALLREYDEPAYPSPEFEARLLARLRLQAGFEARPLAGAGRWRLPLPTPISSRLPAAGWRAALLLGIVAILVITAFAAAIAGALLRLREQTPPWRQSSIQVVETSVAPAGWSIDTLASLGDVGKHPALAVGPDGLPVVAFDDGSAGRVRVARCGDPTCSAIGATTDAGPIGTVFLTTAAYVAVGPGGAWIARAVGDPARIELRRVCPEPATDACTAAGPVDLGPGQDPSLRVRSDGRPVVLFGSMGSGDSQLVVCGDTACSLGNVVTTVPVGATERSFVIGADGRPIIAATQAGQLGVLSCLDETCAETTWTSVDAARQPRIALGPEGRPVLAALSGRSLILYRCADMACASGSRSTLADLGPPPSGADEVVFLDLEVGLDGRAFVSLSDAAELRLIGCLTVACNEAARIVLDRTSPDFAVTHALGVDRSGRPFIVYAVRSDLAVARCLRPDCLTTASTSSSASPGASSQPPVTGQPVRTVVDPAGGFNPAVTIGADGRPVAVYGRGDGVYVLHCGNAKCDQGNTVAKISADNAYASSIAIGRDGLPVLAYLDFDGKLSVVRCHDTGCSDAPSIEHPTAGAEFEFVAVAVPADDRPLIAYLKNASAEIHLARCADPECRAITSARVDSNPDRSLPVSIELRLAPDGAPILGYAFANGVARIGRCSDLDCSKPTVTTVGTGGIETDTAALGIGQDGVPVLAFYSDGSLRVARCDDTTCGSVSSVQVDQATATWWTPIGVGFSAEGNPVIAYFSPTNRDTKLARCHDSACTSADLIALGASDANGADDHTGVAFLPDGTPVFIYSREPSLYAEVCTDPRCGE